jgi:hypothetical protein
MLCIRCTSIPRDSQNTSKRCRSSSSSWVETSKQTLEAVRFHHHSERSKDGVVQALATITITCSCRRANDRLARVYGLDVALEPFLLTRLHDRGCSWKMRFLGPRGAPRLHSAAIEFLRFLAPFSIDRTALLDFNV